MRLSIMKNWLHEEKMTPSVCPLNSDEVNNLLAIVRDNKTRLSRIERLIIGATILLAAIGCQSIIDSSKSYAFGDITRSAVAKVKRLNEQYCSEENHEARKLISTAIKMEIPLYPDNGLCGVHETVESFLKDNEKS